MNTIKISNIQVATLTASTIASMRLLIFQQEIVSMVHQDAWISIMLGSILVLLSGLNIYVLMRLNPKKDYPQIILHNTGKAIGRLILIPGSLFALFNMGFIIRIFTDVTKNFLLPNTPAFAISLLMILTIVSVVKRGLLSIARMSDLIIPFFLIFLLFLILFSTKQANITNIKPILYRNTFNIFKSIFPVYGAFIGYSIIGYILLYTPDPKKTLKWSIIGMLIPMMFYTLLTLMTVLSFGPTEIETLVYPTLSLARSIEFPVTLLERLEILVIIIWIPSAFIYTAIIMFASIRNISTLFSLKPKHYKYVAYGHVIPLSAVCLIKSDILQTFDLISIAEKAALPQGLVFIPALTIISLVKRRKERKRLK